MRGTKHYSDALARDVQAGGGECWRVVFKAPRMCAARARASRVLRVPSIASARWLARLSSLWPDESGGGAPPSTGDSKGCVQPV